MDRDYWHRQTTDTPLFPDLQWSRPENRAHAGKLVIIGGNAYGFAAAAEAYTYAQTAGIGSARVLLPDALLKNVSKLFPEAEYAPSTPSGSFAKTTLGELLPMAHWADGVLLAGDLGRNSETAILIESFLRKHDGQVTLTKDAIEYASAQSALIKARDNTLLVLSFSQLQKLASNFAFATAFTSDMGLPRAVDALHEFTRAYPLAIITKHYDNICVAVGGQVSTTPCPADERIWRVRVAAGASVWWLQNSNNSFAALTSGIVA